MQAGKKTVEEENKKSEVYNSALQYKQIVDDLSGSHSSSHPFFDLDLNVYFPFFLKKSRSKAGFFVEFFVERLDKRFFEFGETVFMVG